MKQLNRLYFINILIYVAVVISFYFFANINIFDAPLSDKTAFTYEEFILMNVFIFVFFFFALFLNRKYLRIKANALMLLGVLFLSVCSLATFLMMPDTIEVPASIIGGTVSLDVTLETKVYGFLSSVVSFFMFYLFLYILPQLIRFKKQINWLIYILLVVIAGLMIYSYITEFSCYTGFISSLSGEDIYSSTVKSLMEHRNVYGFILFLGILGLVYFHQQKPNIFNILGMIFIFINMIFTLCKTTLILSVIVIGVYGLVRFFFSYKEHKKRNWIVMGAFLACVAIVILIVGLSFVIDSGIFLRIRSLVGKVFSWTGATFESRTQIWGAVIEIISTRMHYLAIGVGYVVFNQVLLAHTSATNAIGIPTSGPTNSTHNGFLQILGDGGAILFIFFAIAVIYVIYVAIRMYKKDKELSIISLLFLFCALFIMVFEDRVLFLSKSLDTMFLTFISTTPILSRYYHSRHPIYREEVVLQSKIATDERNAILPEKYSLAKLISFIFCPIVAVFAASSFTFVDTYRFDSTIIIILSIIAVLLYLCLPFFVQVIYNKVKKNTVDYGQYIKEVAIFYFVNLVILFGVVAAFFYFSSTKTNHLLILSFILIPLMYYLVIMALDGTRKFTSTDNIIKRINYRLLMHNAKEIENDKLEYRKTPHLNEATITDNNVLLVASDDLYRENISKALKEQGFNVIIYEELIQNFIHKVNNVMPWRSSLEHSRVFIDDILYDNLTSKISYVIVVTGRGVTLDMIHDLREYHDEAKFIYYMPHLMNKYFYSRFILSSFDSCYTLSDVDAYKFDMKPINSFYLSEALKYRDEKITDDFVCLCNGNMKDLVLLKNATQQLFEHFEKGSVFVKLPAKSPQKFLKNVEKTYPEFYKKITFVTSFYKDEILLGIAKAKYTLDISSKDDINNLDLLNASILNRKIITNNLTAKTFEYYSPYNIYIYFTDQKLDFSVPFFTEEKYEDFYSQIVETNSPKKFVEKLIS